LTIRYFGGEHPPQEAAAYGILRPYFPNLPKGKLVRYAGEIPLSNAFWRQYAEPLRDVRFAALGLRDAVETLAPQEVGDEDEFKRREERRPLMLRSLNRLADSTVPTLAVTDSGEFAQRFSSPSLLAMLATMVILDLSGQQGLRRCPCGQLFAPIRGGHAVLLSHPR
jgi:hypothetical protein